MIEDDVRTACLTPLHRYCSIVLTVMYPKFFGDQSQIDSEVNSILVKNDCPGVSFPSPYDIGQNGH